MQEYGKTVNKEYTAHDPKYKRVLLNVLLLVVQCKI